MEKEQKKVKYPTTANMRFLNADYLKWNGILSEVIKPVPFWKNVKHINIAFVVSKAANSNQSLWEAVYKEYPELLGKSLRYSEKEIIEL